MTKKMTIEQMIDYLGFPSRSIYYWRKRKVDFETMINEFKKCDGYGCQRNIFYSTFLNYTQETVIDRLWNSYIRHRLKKEEFEKQKHKAQQRIKQIVKDRKEGRVI